MSLGSIAHLQYYFARTGLLDGKGAQLAKSKKNGDYEIPQLRLSTDGLDGELTASPIDEDLDADWDVEPQMLPPTVSTYHQRAPYVPPPPDMKVLNKELVQSLENALHALEAVEKAIDQDAVEGAQGYYEIQGLHILDVTTLAIRAARIYYTSHDNPARLASIKSERMLRSELLSVMDILRKYATRKFAGGLREDEKLAVLVWVSDVSQMINTESKLEEAEKREREAWKWMHLDDRDWEGKEKEREWHFLNSLLSWIPSETRHSENLPASLPCFSTTETTLSSKDPLLGALSDGRLLVHFHNNAVKRSKRQFGCINSHHKDIIKPYRRADNLRFWIKAAELRWEIKLEIDVMGIVYEKEDERIWKAFEQALLKWCRGVREEITRDWKAGDRTGGHERNGSAVTITPETFAASTTSSSESRVDQRRPEVAEMSS